MAWPLTPDTPVLEKLPLGASLVLTSPEGSGVTSVRGWIVPELDGHISQCQRAGRHRFTQWALASLNPIGVVHRQVGLPGPSLPQAQLALVLDLSPTSTYLCSCLPALPTHLAVLRLL